MRPAFDPAKPMCLAGWGEVEGWLPYGLTFSGIEHRIYAIDGQPDDLSGSFIMSFIRDGEKDVPQLYQSYFQKLCEALGQFPDYHLDSSCSETKTFQRRATWLGDVADLELNVAASWESSYYEYVDFAIYCYRSNDVWRRSRFREQLALDVDRFPDAESDPRD